MLNQYVNLFLGQIAACRHRVANPLAQRIPQALRGLGGGGRGVDRGDADVGLADSVAVRALAGRPIVQQLLGDSDDGAANCPDP